MVEYTLLPDLNGEVQIPEKGILSRTLHNDEYLKLVLFGFAPGEELSAHTAPFAASIYFVRGDATVTLGNDTREVSAGAFVHMAPQLTHGIAARTPVVMLLSMLKQARAG
jgi:quercetin dioxygenase-like cupin family protein